MRIVVLAACSVILAMDVRAQVGSSISADGTAPNANAMLDVKSPATGAGKGLLIPRVTANQRTNASAAVAGGLLDNSGNLRGGAAQGLMVYQTDGAQGLYFNTSATTVPAWVCLGSSPADYLPLAGGTMLGPLDLGGQGVSNAVGVDFSTEGVPVGRGAVVADMGTAVGYQANGANGVAVGQYANGAASGTAVGMHANGSNVGVAVGYGAIGTNYGAAVGFNANGAANGAALGAQSIATADGVAVGRAANGSGSGAAVGYSAKAAQGGAALGYNSQASGNGAAVGQSALGTNVGAAVGNNANGVASGAALGYNANGWFYGAAVGRDTDGSDYGVAIGYRAAGSSGNVAIGAFADTDGGTARIAIGYGVTNRINNTVCLSGDLYLDGGLSVYTNGTPGSAGWGVKAFTIPHPLDPANKVLRHYCLEGPEVWNVYAGNAQLVGGQAVVELPDYYAALNLAGSEVYALTPVGALAQVAVGAEVDGNRFTIIGDRDVKVSWTIKVLRNDPGCIEDLKLRPVEQFRGDIPAGH